MREVREAAEPFTRVLVRVPEAYALLGPFEATRPGLLVLDADGRRVDALGIGDTPGATRDPAAVARWLRDAWKAPALERFVLWVDPGPGGGEPKAFFDAARRVAGVERADRDDRNEVRIVAGKGSISPAVLARLAEEAKVSVEVLQPVPVRFSPEEGADPLAAERTLAGVAGVWSVTEEGKGILAWVPPLLLDPAALARAAPRLVPDVEARRFAIPGVSLGPPGMHVAATLKVVSGVLSVTPALASGTVTVVGRRGAIDWERIPADLKAIGIEAREEK